MIPDVTILLPVHGEGEFLVESITSCFTQELIGSESVEVLVVLDRPTQKLFNIVNEIIDPRLRVLTSPGAGIVSALNFGLANSKAEYIARLDGDDRMLPNRISKQIEYLRAHPHTVVLGSQVLLINQFGAGIGTSNYAISPTRIRELMKSRCHLSHPSVMFRREEIVDLGGYRDFYQHAEDFDLWTRCLEAGDISILDECLTEYRIHSNQVSLVKSFEQQIATHAVIVSSRRRENGDKDLSDDFETVNNWFNNSNLRALKLKVTLMQKYSVLRRGKSLRSIFLLPAIIFLNPEFLFGIFQKLRNKISNAR